MKLQYNTYQKDDKTICVNRLIPLVYELAIVSRYRCDDCLYMPTTDSTRKFLY